ncbi:MAG: 16S rRNA (adenine(1518)-N(6)/adenine(1519)-N(6))-dimethyltransferase RsmA [Roseiflexus sp.]|nr:16S rRNA (adenine(1518)-N(6)/adenine(1519)-N(6))-dimethyltransferase RsmA [Roseiflexus sp.]MCS7289507.1 16S rRNA (adenine(1518)-N(6)/adenine(1519)-N(6))-dimethyltransferase RsmA [Roseiflexus sp.]MDW8145069.1 16S rRNA (adenine(1518)-N(6)/adenine(1519)-N(6))-dimethyltransferase RsmA [Roseiflexaceae bacterium]MDW8233503.1 16S rRNA (adenine(1518)-N(6)/adenine(1519)-N(6))-dimethyltransferase RsmA [Roseiflexaceae bacterium]
MTSANPYLSPARVRAALRALDLRPSRSMGQNFLIDGAALMKIVNAAELTADDTVIEIGPGLGVLTWELVQRARAVIAVELDRRLAERLRAEFRTFPNLAIIQGDVLRLPPPAILAAYDPEAASGARPYKVVANLPYAITSAALRHFLSARLRPTLMVVLVQREVADRICAHSGDMSVLTHAVQIYAEPEVVARVPASCFFPAPEVESSVLRLRIRPQPAVAPDQPESLLRLIKAGFLHPRKQLGNALPSGMAAMGIKTDKQKVLAALAAAGIDPTRRAETVTLDEWGAVYRALNVEQQDVGLPENATLEQGMGGRSQR